MTTKNGRPPLLKAIYLSIRDAMAYRQLDRSPDNRDIVYNNYDYGNGTPRIDAALQLSTVFACVRLIAETISTLPLFVYKRVADRRLIAREHPLYSLLHDSPNADMTAVEYWEAVVSQLLLWGNSYTLKTRDVNKNIVSLDPLNPALVTVRRNLDGSLTYIYADPRGRVEHTEDDIWHIKGFGVSGYTGLSPIGVGWRSMLGAAAAEKVAADLFTNNGRPAGVISTKEWLKKEQRDQLKDKVMGAVFGDARTGQLQLLEGDMTYTQLTMNPVDAQVLETRTFTVEELCRWFNVPPSMIGHGTMVSNWGTGREQINLGFLQYVLRPYLVRIEQGVRKSLLSAVERTKYYAEFSLEGLLRGDSQARAQYYATMIQNAVMKPAECRELENLEPDEAANVLFMQSNVIPVSLSGKTTNSTATPAADNNGT